MAAILFCFSSGTEIPGSEKHHHGQIGTPSRHFRNSVTGKRTWYDASKNDFNYHVTLVSEVESDEFFSLYLDMVTQDQDVSAPAA